MKSDLEIIESIKERTAKDCGYDSFAELLIDNCKSKLIAASLNNITNHIPVVFMEKYNAEMHSEKMKTENTRRYAEI